MQDKVVMGDRFAGPNDTDYVTAWMELNKCNLTLTPFIDPPKTRAHQRQPIGTGIFRQRNPGQKDQKKDQNFVTVICGNHNRTYGCYSLLYNPTLSLLEPSSQSTVAAKMLADRPQRT